MLHGIFKEYQIHYSVDLIVRLKCFLQDLVETGPRGDGQILGLSNTTSKVTEDEWVCFQSFLIQILRGNTILLMTYSEVCGILGRQEGSHQYVQS